MPPTWHAERSLVTAVTVPENHHANALDIWSHINGTTEAEDVTARLVKVLLASSAPFTAMGAGSTTEGEPATDSLRAGGGLGPTCA